jgi:hypothetical protein
MIEIYVDGTRMVIPVEWIYVPVFEIASGRERPRNDIKENAVDGLRGATNQTAMQSISEE